MNRVEREPEQSGKQEIGEMQAQTEECGQMLKSDAEQMWSLSPVLEL